MKKVLVIGSGISGLTAAIECAYQGMEATIVSPYSSERAQSVLLGAFSVIVHSHSWMSC